MAKLIISAPANPLRSNRIYSLLQQCTDFQDQPVYRPRRAGEVLKIALDSGRAGRELGWEPKVSLEEGLQLSVDYVRSSMVRRSGRARLAT